MCDENKLISNYFDHILKLIEIYQDHRSKVKNWCITIWIATITIIATKLINYSSVLLITIILPPVIMFWIIEAMYDGAMKIFYNRYI
jgi:uncharacterized membrane protein